MDTRNINPFEIRSIGYADFNAFQDLLGRRNYDMHRIVWFKNIDAQPCHITQGVIFSICPGQVFDMQEPVLAEGYILSFSTSFLNAEDERITEFLTSDRQDVPAKFNVPNCENEYNELLFLITQMQYEYIHGKLFRTELLQSLLQVFLIKSSRYQIKEIQDDAAKDYDLLNAFISLVSEHYIDLKRVSDYALLLSVTSNHLNFVIKRDSGYTAKFHIQKQIIREADRMAIWEKRCLKEISFKLKFADPSHFSKFYKNVTGVNFSNFRKKDLKCISEKSRLVLSFVPMLT